MSAENESLEIAHWLAARTPRPPRDLELRLTALIGDSRATPAELPDALIGIAADAFAHLGDDRESALELLAADALITYAMEAAAEFHVEGAASRAMMRIADVTAR